MTRLFIRSIAIPLLLGLIFQGCEPVNTKTQSAPVKAPEAPLDRPTVTDTDPITNNTIRPDEVEQIKQRGTK